MPDGVYTDGTISGAESVPWVRMSDYRALASNHCAATAITNLALYFADRGYPALLKNGSAEETFRAIHRIVGDGPVMMIAKHAADYFAACGYRLRYSGLGTPGEIIAATAQDRPCGILLVDRSFACHWVLGVGWRQYAASGDFYLRVNDNWSGGIDRYYRPESGSAWWSVTAYRIDD